MCLQFSACIDILRIISFIRFIHGGHLASWGLTAHVSQIHSIAVRRKTVLLQMRCGRDCIMYETCSPNLPNLKNITPPRSSVCTVYQLPWTVKAHRVRFVHFLYTNTRIISYHKAVVRPQSLFPKSFLYICPSFGRKSWATISVCLFARYTRSVCVRLFVR